MWLLTICTYDGVCRPVVRCGGRGPGLRALHRSCAACRASWSSMSLCWRWAPALRERMGVRQPSQWAALPSGRASVALHSAGRQLSLVSCSSAEPQLFVKPAHCSPARGSTNSCV